jgi:TLC domain
MRDLLLLGGYLTCFLWYQKPFVFLFIASISTAILTWIRLIFGSHFTSFLHSLCQSIGVIVFLMRSEKNFGNCWSLIETVDHFQFSIHLHVIILFAHTWIDLCDKNKKMDMVFHHIIVLMCCIIALNVKSHQTFGMILLLNEASTPFLNLWKMNIYKKISGILFVLTFLVFRIFLLFYLLIVMNPCNTSVMNQVVYAILWVLTTLNCFWFYKILKSINKIK